MFIDRLLNQGNTPLLEKMLSYSEKRLDLIAQNMANISTPGYIQKDTSESAFQQKLRDRISQRAGIDNGQVSFDDITAEIDQPKRGMLFHDRNNRSMEQLQSDLASNALKHNMYVELMRKQYSQLNMALKERVE